MEKSIQLGLPVWQQAIAWGLVFAVPVFMWRAVGVEVLMAALRLFIYVLFLGAATRQRAWVSARGIELAEWWVFKRRVFPHTEIDIRFVDVGVLSRTMILKIAGYERVNEGFGFSDARFSNWLGLGTSRILEKVIAIDKIRTQAGLSKVEGLAERYRDS